MVNVTVPGSVVTAVNTGMDGVPSEVNTHWYCLQKTRDNNIVIIMMKHVYWFFIYVPY